MPAQPDPAAESPRPVSSLLDALKIPADPALRRRLADHLRQQNLSGLRVMAWLAAALVPFFWVLDWLTLPHYVWFTLVLRLACAAFGARVLIGLARRDPFVLEHPGGLGISLCLAVAWAIAVMCWLDAGYESRYYAGICLVVLATGFVQSSPERSAVALGGMYAFYLAPLVFGLVPIRNPSVFASNQFFLLSTMVITYLGQRLRYQLEIRSFALDEERARLTGELERQAATDGLTGLFNRRELLRVSQAELARARRYGHPLSLLLIDVDHFKAVNDTYGHGAGDDVLRRIGAMLHTGLREQDVVARYGGEEFAVLLPDTGPETAAAVAAERIRMAVAAAPIGTMDGPIPVTVSVGVASMGPTTLLEDLLRDADEALYRAKRTGRNRVCLAGGEAVEKAGA